MLSCSSRIKLRNGAWEAGKGNREHKKLASSNRSSDPTVIMIQFSLHFLIRVLRGSQPSREGVSWCCTPRARHIQLLRSFPAASAVQPLPSDSRCWRRPPQPSHAPGHSSLPRCLLLLAKRERSPARLRNGHTPPLAPKNTRGCRYVDGSTGPAKKPTHAVFFQSNGNKKL